MTTTRTRTAGANRKVAPARPAPARRSVPVWGIAIAGILVLGVVAVVAALATDEPKTNSEFGVVAITGAPLPEFARGGLDPAVGELAPVVEGAGFDGTLAGITAGRPTMIVFLAHWCPHCNAEAPRLRAYLDAEGVPDDVDIVIVPTGSNPNAEHWPPSEWIEQQGLDGLEVLVDDEATSAANSFGLDGYPYIVLLDADRKVVERRSGEQPEGAFADMIATLRNS